MNQQHLNGHEEGKGYWKFKVETLYSSLWSTRLEMAMGLS
jgi:hypothetical protein